MIAEERLITRSFLRSKSKTAKFLLGNVSELIGIARDKKQERRKNKCTVKVNFRKLDRWLPNKNYKK